MTTLPSRKLGGTFAGVFLIGATVGGLLVWSLQDVSLSRFFSHTSDPKAMAARIDQSYVSKYQLSADEQARIAPLIQEMASRLYSARRQFGVDIVGALDDYHQRIGDQMTPDHRRVYEQDNADRKKRMSAMLLLDSPAAAAAGTK